MFKIILTCSSCYEMDYNWQRQGEHRILDPVRKRSELLHQSIPSVDDNGENMC